MRNISKIKFNKLLHFIRFFLIVFFVGLFFRIFVIEISIVSSESMKNTIYSSEIILINKALYGIYFPFLSTEFTYLEYFFSNEKVINQLETSKRIFSFGSIARFDLIIFERKELSNNKIVKRCIGMPGDTLKIINTIVYLNQKKVNETYAFYKENTVNNQLRKRQFLVEKTLKVFPNVDSLKWDSENFGPLLIPYEGQRLELNESNIVFYKEIISCDKGYDTAVINRAIRSNGKTVITIQQNYYFMLGDNRCNSYDSRYFGFVPESHIIGKATCILWSYGEREDGSVGIRWNRLFKRIE